jgi:hypothetical protein
MSEIFELSGQEAKLIEMFRIPSAQLDQRAQVEGLDKQDLSLGRDLLVSSQNAKERFPGQGNDTGFRRLFLLVHLSLRYAVVCPEVWMKRGFFSGQARHRD